MIISMTNTTKKKGISLGLLFILLLSQASSFPLIGESKRKKKPTPIIEKTDSKATEKNSKQALSAGQSAMVKQWFSRGQWQLVDKNYPEAIIIYKKVLEMSPQDSRALNQLALAYYFHGQYTLALKNVNLALNLDPVNTKLYFTKARILDAQSKEPEAMDNYLSFASLDPTDTATLQAQRRADELFKRWEPKLTSAQKVYFTGLRFLSMEQPKKALPLLEKFKKEHPENLNAHLLLGIAYFQMGKSALAIQSFETVTQKEPENPMAYFRLGESYARIGEIESAESAWEKFIQFAPHSHQVGAIYQKLLHHRESQTNPPINHIKVIPAKI